MTRRGCTASLKTQSNSAWNSVTKYLHHQTIWDTAVSWQDHESVFWDFERVIHVDFLPHDVTIHAQYYSNFLCNDVHQAIPKKIPAKLSKNMILLYVIALTNTTTWQQWTGKSRTLLLTALTEPPRSLLVWTTEGAPRRPEILNWWWTQMRCPELAMQSG
jgi:hypothetical protein